tara:strand:- start:1434 stop:2213 length:780 start_codon:yes stop_codon:yes gene_type:complete
MKNVLALIAMMMAFTSMEAAHAATVLITGANRGLGLEFARLYADRGWDVIATCRTPSEAGDLDALKAQHSKVVIEELDVTDQSEIDSLAVKYKDRPIDLLINNAGILGDLGDQSLGSFNHEEFKRVMDTNVYGALAVTQAFKDNVIASEHKKIIAMTSVAGSLVGPWQNLGGLYYYRASKSALNNVMRAVGIDLKKHGVVVGLVAPGAAGTDMLREDFKYKGPMISPAESVAGMVKAIDGFTQASASHPINYDGEVLDW